MHIFYLQELYKHLFIQQLKNRKHTSYFWILFHTGLKTDPNALVQVFLNLGQAPLEGV